ncbi:hypothetical protein HKI87_18g87700 [Chloropicon roscoffensis]|uniref:Uncharacterized protein n=1 Tax=Chloropicon roscoffensis TaxID=1461544 RepID=A0AAX4PNA2_9CHLO
MVILDREGGRSSRSGWVSDIQPTPSGSQHDLLELRRGLANLTKQHKSATARVDSLREERLALRQKLTTKEKQLSLMKRRVSALSGERDALERERATERAHLHKLEAKVAVMDEGGQLYDKFQSAKRRHRQCKEENAALKAKLQTCAEEHQTQCHEIATLQTALRLKTQEIVEETGKDIPTRLLYAVARSREDGVMLAIQLTDEKERSRNLAAELAISRKEVAKGEEARAAAMELLEAKERSILSLQAASTSLQRNYDKLQAQFDDSRKELNAKAEQCEGFRSELDKSRQAEEAARAEMAEAEARAAQREKDLRAELVGALERESASAAEDKRMAGEAIQSLESQLTSTQRDLREAEYNHQQAVLEIERQQVALREQEERIQGILLHADSKEQALKEDLKALDAHCSVLNEKCSGLADELASSRSDVSFQQQKAEEAGRRAKRSDGVLEEEEKKWQEERGRMMGKLEDALVQLSAAIEKSDRVEREAAAARAECKLKDGKIAQMLQDLQQIRESNQALYKSKELLQRAMLEQVNDVRQRLDHAGNQNRELEATVYRQRETERVLKDMIRSTNNSPLAPRAVAPRQQPAAASVAEQLAFPSPVPGIAGPSPTFGAPTADPAVATTPAPAAAEDGSLHFPSLEQLAGIDKDVISKLLTPQSAMRLRSL